MNWKKIGPTALLGFGAIAAGVLAALLGRRAADEAERAATGQGRTGQGKIGQSSMGQDTTGQDTTGQGAPADARAGGAIPAPTGKAELDKGFTERPGNPAAEHVPTDLLSDVPVTRETRAPEAFRPDPTAVPTAEEREALRPATGPAPTLAADRGSVNA